jgi:hypothetical protein
MKDRRPNDLDDYLAEVEDGLFCISEEDRECLLRDLKAHVSELTTDPDHADRFSGRYGITRDQLLEEIGRPSDIAVDYVASVRIMPSIPMVAFLSFIGAMFVIIALVGIERIAIAISFPDMDRWISYLFGFACILGGGLLIFLTVRIRQDFVKNHRFLPFLVIILGLISIPITQEFMRLTFYFRFLSITDTNLPYLYGLILIDFFIIAMLGLYVSMEHIRVIEVTRATRNM